MEKKVKGLIALSCLSVLAMGAIVGVAAGNSAAVEDAFLGVEAAIVPTTRRVYVINNTVEFDSWYKWDNGLYLYDTHNTTWYPMTQLFGDYCDGLYYCDIDYSHNKVIISGQNSWGDNGWQTEDVILDTFGTADVLKFNAHWENVKYARDTSEGANKAGVGEGQMQWLLSFFDSCSADTSYGYGAYLQLKADFLDATSDEVKSSSAKVRTDGEHESRDVTIAQKLAFLEQQYNKHK